MGAMGNACQTPEEPGPENEYGGSRRRRTSNDDIDDQLDKLEAKPLERKDTEYLLALPEDQLRDELRQLRMAQREYEQMKASQKSSTNAPNLLSHVKESKQKDGHNLRPEYSELIKMASEDQRLHFEMNNVMLETAQHDARTLMKQLEEERRLHKQSLQRERSEKEKLQDQSTAQLQIDALTEQVMVLKTALSNEERSSGSFNDTNSDAYEQIQHMDEHIRELEGELIESKLLAAQSAMATDEVKQLQEEMRALKIKAADAELRAEMLLEQNGMLKMALS